MAQSSLFFPLYRQEVVMATKIIAGVFLIVALAAAGTVGVAYVSDYSFGNSICITPDNESSCQLEKAPTCTLEPPPCCNMPARDELIKCGGVIGQPPAENKNAGD
jgi:hypothetical protein